MCRDETEDDLGKKILSFYFLDVDCLDQFFKSIFAAMGR
jgi:hypothetical protein